ncbi:MAG: S-layer homology domain-containing protein [Clostridia bacterium]|nr:S-layer homology domain-containing protein [Clostridia bacterium]
MRKRIITLMLSLILAISLVTCVYAASSQVDAQRLLGVLGIMNGDENGDLKLDNNVTRAEFSKMLVTASIYKDSISTSAISTGFSDVSASHWAAPYIRVAANNKWIYGYSDGTFAPSSNIKLEEAATMLLRILGYTSSDVTGVYPNGQLALYEALELDDGVESQRGDTVTRRDCVNLFVNLLNAKTKQGQVYAQTLGYSLGTDGKIDIYKTVSDEMTGPYVLENGLSDLPVDTSGYTVYKDDSAVSASDVSKYDVAYYSQALKSVWIYNDTVTGTYDSAVLSGSLPTSVSVSGKNYSFEENDAAKSMSVYGEFAKEDAVTLLLGKDGRIVKVLDAADYHSTDTDEYLSIVNNTLDGPYVYTGEALPFMNDSVKYVMESAETSASALKAYDILYYSKVANTVWVYRDAVTGKYNAATPSVSSPSSVTVGAKNYAIETSEAAYDLSFMGKFELEDMVTLLLGKDGGVAAVYSIDDHMHIDEDNYLELVESTLEGPYVVTSSYAALGLPTSGVSVMRNDAASSVSAIKLYDVVYYSEVAKTVIVYSKTVSGTYMSAAPNADTPSQITVAGNTYTIANSEIALTVSTIGQFKPGDLITLLLGRNDEVAGVISMSTFANNVYGVVTGVASENYTDTLGMTYSAKTVTMMTTDGETLKLEGILNSLTSGDIVKVSYTDGVKVEKMSSRAVSGKVDGYTIGTKEVAADVNILETNIYGEDPIPVFFSRLTGATLTDDDVRYYAINSKGEITDIILSDFSGDSYTYGIITTAQSTSGFVSDDEDYDYSQITSDNFIYEYQIGSSARSMTVTRPYTYSTGPCVFKYNGQSLEEITALRKLSSVDTYTSFGIVSSGELYLYSDYLTVYTPNTNKQSALDYSVMSISELTNNIDSYNVHAYYDTTPKNGGRIRIIIAIKK